MKSCGDQKSNYTVGHHEKREQQYQGLPIIIGMFDSIYGKFHGDGERDDKLSKSNMGSHDDVVDMMM